MVLLEYKFVFYFGIVYFGLTPVKHLCFIVSANAGESMYSSLPVDALQIYECYVQFPVNPNQGCPLIAAGRRMCVGCLSYLDIHLRGQWHSRLGLFEEIIQSM